MRALLLFCALLLFANVVVLLWPSNSENATHVYAERDDINPHFLTLNKEVESKYYKSVMANAGDLNLEAGEACYRLGPFMFKSNYDLAQAVLFNAQIEFDKSIREAQQSLVYRVYLGPFTSQAEVDDMRVELKRKNILDHFVRKIDNQSSIISLGIYTTEEAANRAVSLFAGSLDEIQSQQEQLLLPESFWLHFVLSESDSALQQLPLTDWGETAVKLGEYECFQG